MSPPASQWDARYRDRSVAQARAARVLREHTGYLPHGGEALDLACGLGANACLLARRGLRAQAWDLSPVAVAKLTAYAQQMGLPLQAQVRDCEQYPPAPAAFDVIVVSRFLHQPSMPALVAALRPGGILYYETFVGLADAAGPANPAYRLEPDELRERLADLNVLFYEEDAAPGEDGARCARVVARRVLSASR